MIMLKNTVSSVIILAFINYLKYNYIIINYLFIYFIILAKNVMFILFNGEAYDYIGSSRVTYDMSKENFPNNIVKLNQDHVGLYVELSQIHYEKEIFVYRSLKYNVFIYTDNFNFVYVIYLF